MSPSTAQRQLDARMKVEQIANQQVLDQLRRKAIGEVINRQRRIERRIAQIVDGGNDRERRLPRRIDLRWCGIAAYQRVERRDQRVERRQQTQNRRRYIVDRPTEIEHQALNALDGRNRLAQREQRAAYFADEQRQRVILRHARCVTDRAHR